MPRVETTLITPDGVGVVTEVKPLQNTVKVILENDTEKSPRVYHLSVLKPYDKDVAEAQAGGEKKASPTGSEDTKKDQKNKREQQNKNRQQKPQKSASPADDAQTQEKALEKSPEKTPSEDKNKNQHSHHQKKNKRSGHGGNKNATNKAQGEGSAKPQTSKPASEPLPAPQPKPQEAPKNGGEGKRDFTPLPSNSIKRGQAGRFGGVNTRPSGFGKKDNSEKK